MRARVKQVADQMGYVPNLTARNLKTRQSGLIGIYAASAQDDVRVAIINSLVTGLHSTHHKPMLGIADSPDDSWIAAPWIESFRALGADALVVATWELQKTAGTLFRQIPTIVVGCPPVENPRLVDCVALDRYEAGRVGVEHLLARGRTRICICAIPHTDDFTQGCLEALRQARIEPCGPLAMKYRSSGEIHAFCSALLASRPKPTSVIFGDSATAAIFLSDALQRGVRIPQDLAVIGYDYLAWADHLKVPLTTIEQPVSEMASLAVDLVKKRLADPDAPTRQYVLPHRLVVRESA